ncbi:hypothetical protein HDV57DRAFT_495422 [Trichoderma longibrachiatum]
MKNWRIVALGICGLPLVGEAKHVHGESDASTDSLVTNSTSATSDFDSYVASTCSSSVEKIPAEHLEIGQPRR